LPARRRRRFPLRQSLKDDRRIRTQVKGHQNHDYRPDATRGDTTPGDTHAAPIFHILTTPSGLPTHAELLGLVAGPWQGDTLTQAQGHADPVTGAAGFARDAQSRTRRPAHRARQIGDKTHHFHWGSLAIRLVIALTLVLLTYNPSGYSYVHWVRGALSAGSAGPEHYFVGVVLIIGWVVFLRATFLSLGGVGRTYATACPVASMWTT
jgi:hypothetical protein